MRETELVELVRGHAQPLGGGMADYDGLLELIGEARFVLIGEATHGTHEFYKIRAEITKRLIKDRGFTAVAVEADWPDAYRANRYVRGIGSDRTGLEALGGFGRFPTWMWRNADVLDFIGWLRAHNDAIPEHACKAGFYGLDLYSLHSSIDEVVAYLDQVDPEAARRARQRYACFEHFGDDPQAYGYVAGLGMAETCEEGVVSQLLEFRRRADELVLRNGFIAEDERFYAEQNARIAMNAEQYYRSMFRGRASSWNLRDSHMADTLNALVAHLDRHGGRTKAVVWAHNSHIGDASATEMGEAGEHNIGQLVRKRYGDDAVLIGFSTYAGTVSAASDWDAPVELKHVRPGLPGSYEELFHNVGHERFLLPLRGQRELAEALHKPRLQRAIGVIYLPETERRSHYFHTTLPQQFDAMIHIDQTRAVEPLDGSSGWRHDDLPETYPSGDLPLSNARGG